MLLYALENIMTKLYIACDHAGLELKEKLIAATPEIEWLDLGVNTKESANYPDYAQRLCDSVLENSTTDELLNPCGVLICGSGMGMSMAANRYRGIRAALCTNAELAKMSRLHNASNVLCLGERFVSEETAIEIFNTWLNSEFEGGRHLNRIELIEKRD